MTLRREPDVVFGEQFAHAVARARTEHGERTPLRRDERDLRSSSCRAYLAGGQERKLIEREGPGNPRRDHEGKPPDRSRLDLLDDLAEALDVLRAAEGERTRNGLARPRAARHDERVVRERVSLRRLHPAGRDIDRCESALAVFGIRSLGEGPEREAVNATQPERLCHGQRPIEKLRVRCKELDSNACSRERPQGEHRLKSRETSTPDDDLDGVAPVHASMIAASGRIRLTRSGSCRHTLETSGRARL